MRKFAALLLIAICSLVLLLAVLFHSGRAGDDVWTTNGPYGVRIMDLKIDPNNPDIIYGTTPDRYSNYSVFKSIDGGLNWFPSSNGIPPQIEIAWHDSLVFDPEDSRILFIATERGIYASYDAGASWVQKFPNPTLSIAMTSNGVLFIGVNSDNIHRSYDRGETWERISDAPYNSHNLKAAPGSPLILYASDPGLNKSIDGGETWEQINNGFYTPPQVAALAIDPYDSRVVYFADLFTTAIFKTSDGGQSWNPLGEGYWGRVRSFAIDPYNQQVIYIGTTGGFFRSLDNTGTSWVPMMSGMPNLEVWAVAIDHSNPQNVYAGSGVGIWKMTLLGQDPVDYSLSINNGALFTNQVDVSLHLSAPSGTSEMLISNDGGFAGAAWQPFQTPISWTLTSYQDYVLPRSVYARFLTDDEVSGLYVDDIVLDQTAPSGSVAITSTLPSRPQLAVDLRPSELLTHSLFLPVAFKYAVPGFDPVGLLLQANDDLSGVAEMLVSNQADFDGARWQRFEEWLVWWVPDGGSGSVYVRFRDRAGNLSSVYSAPY